MPPDQSHPVKVWAGVVLFFGVGVFIAGAIAFAHVRSGGSVAGGMAAGSFVGGYGAWFAFFAGYRIVRGLKRVDRHGEA